MSELEKMNSDDVWLVFRRSARATEEEQTECHVKCNLWKQKALKYGLIKDKIVTTDDYGNNRMKDDEEIVIQIPKEKNYVLYYGIYIFVFSVVLSIFFQYVEVSMNLK